MEDLKSFFTEFGLEKYEIQQKIGESPLGEIYHLYHPEQGDCLLKYFYKKVFENKKFLKKFLPSLMKLKEIQHPNIAKIYEIIESDRFSIIREFVVGDSIEDYMEDEEKFTVKRATEIILDVSMALFAGYPFKILYRNIKPSNIIIANETTKLVDVIIPPTDPHFISPEIWSKNKKSDVHSDIYSLGITYFYMLTGTVPFTGENVEDIKNSHLNSPIPLEKLPENEKLRKCINKMLEKDPDSRQRSPLPIIANLKQILNSLEKDTQEEKKQEIKVDDIKIETNEPLFENTEENQGEETNEEPIHTGMMVALDREKYIKKDIEDFQEKDTDKYQAEKDNLQRKETKRYKEDISEVPTIKAKFEELTPMEDVSEEEPEQKIEEVFLSENMLKSRFDYAISRITNIEEKKERKSPFPIRIVHFPKEYQETIIEALQNSFKRECWLLKDSNTPGELEVEINLEKACILRHFYFYEDLLKKAIEENLIVEGEKPDGPEADDLATVNMDADEVLELPEESERTGDSADTINLVESDGIETINDITLTSITKKVLKFVKPTFQMPVDFSNAYKTMGWLKFINEHNFQKGIHFEFIDGAPNTNQRKAVIYLTKLDNYHQQEDYLSQIKEFFQGDYDIKELDRGGMGVVLKLTAKNDPTILSLRPENFWARQIFNPYLKIVKDSHGKESTYARIPAGIEFVAKVAFEGHEESLIKEARILSDLSEDPHVCETVIGAVQQGRLFSFGDTESDPTKIGYYLMLEYATQGDAEKIYRRFPEQRISPTVAFAIMYGLTQTLQKLNSKGIIHRDIKPGNILFDKNGMPKLSDFGLAISIATKEDISLTDERRRLLRLIDEEFLKVSMEKERTEENINKLKEKLESLNNSEPAFEDTEKELEGYKSKIVELTEKENKRAEELKNYYAPISAEEEAMSKKFCGSIYYAAPEQFDIGSVLTPACDVYQLGTVMYTLMTGQKHVKGKSVIEVMGELISSKTPRISDLLGKENPIIEVLDDLIFEMMARNPMDRIDISQVKDRLDKILFDFAAELKKPLEYEEAEFEEEKEKVIWERKVNFAKQFHEKCIEIIFSKIFQNQQLPELSKEVKKIVFLCPHCSKKLHVYSHMNGKRGTCPGCKKGMVIKLE